MLFPTVEFAIFFFIVFGVSWAIRPWPLARKLFLVAASYFFYGFWNWKFMFLLFSCSLGNYIFGILIGRSKNSTARRGWLVAAVTWNLAILGFFKYYGFFMSSFTNMFTFLGLGAHIPILEIVLPVGISFFTFQAMSYVIDVYRREIAYTTSLLDILLYISFFPQLVAGPIVRAKNFLPQIQRDVDPGKIDASRAFLLIMGGLFKKVVIANYIATELVDHVFVNPQIYSTWELLAGVYGFAVQIYCDFSAYSDIAIGVALLLGYSFPDNFNNPYRSKSFQEFWLRWHISLSTWLRDYLYISMGGSKISKLATYRNIAITMLLGGLWHGASWKFVFWGALHGAGLAVERLLHDKYGVWKKTLAWQVVSVIFVFHFVCLGWIFFKADSFNSAVDYLNAFSNLSTQPSLLTPFVLALLVIGLGMHFLPKGPLDKMHNRFSQLPLYIQGVIMGVFLVILSAWGPEGVAPFIYFQF